MDIINESLWVTENFVSLVEARETSTGEWLGADAIVDEREQDDFILPDYSDQDYQEAEAEALAAYERSIYGD